MTAEAMKQIVLFTYQKEGEKYVKKAITLLDLLTRLSEERSAMQSNRQVKYHSTSEQCHWATSDEMRT